MICVGGYNSQVGGPCPAGYHASRLSAKCVDQPTARVVGGSRPTVRRWVGRFLANPGLRVLGDVDRTGRSPTYGCRERAVIITQACQKPAEVGCLEAWMMLSSEQELTRAAGTAVSRSTVHCVLSRAEVQPHRQRYYLFTNKDSPEFAVRLDAVFAAYTRVLPEDELLLCVEDKTNIQALEPIARSPPKGNGRWRRVVRTTSITSSGPGVHRGDQRAGSAAAVGWRVARRSGPVGTTPPNDRVP